MPKYKYSEETFYNVYEGLGDRLNKTGTITTSEAFRMLDGKVFAGQKQKPASYGCIINIFRMIMDTMVEQNKAEWIGRGVWIITKPDIKRRETSLSNTGAGRKLHAITGATTNAYRS